MEASIKKHFLFNHNFHFSSSLFETKYNTFLFYLIIYVSKSIYKINNFHTNQWSDSNNIQSLRKPAPENFPLTGTVQNEFFCYLNDRDINLKEKFKKNKRIRSVPVLACGKFSGVGFHH